MSKALKIALLMLMVLQLLTAAPIHADGEILIQGRDLGIPIAGTNLLAFGDTTDQTDIHGGPSYTIWQNSLAVRSGRTAVPMINGAWEPIPPGRTSTPTGAMKIGGCLYVWNMNPESNFGDVFAIVNSGVAVSCDNGKSWQEHLLFDGSTPVSQMTPYGAPGSGYIYLLATAGGRLFFAYAVRVPTGRVLDAAAYQFWNGQRWGGLDQAAPVIQDSVGELSISWNTYLRQYLVMYQSPNAGGVVYRTAAALTGPWSAPVVMIPQQGSRFYAPQQASVRTGRTVDYWISDFDIYSVVWRSVTL